MDDKEFRYKVAEMLAAQRRYFDEGRRQSDLIESKKLEREVRSALKEFDDAEHAPVDRQATMDLGLDL